METVQKKMAIYSEFWDLHPISQKASVVLQYFAVYLRSSFLRMQELWNRYLGDLQCTRTARTGGSTGCAELVYTSQTG